ncbi:MAG: TrkA family potassium uptake protein [Aliarcobacter sp.]|nr:TrkA family potassium uptake protein [Aliarcobacter sp.]
MKSVAVIGLGKFGFYVAKSLAKLNITVIAVDSDEEKVQEISRYVDNAFILNSTSKIALEEVGIYNLDTVIVSIGENIESSILTVMALKDLNNRNIIAKAINPTHGEILSKIGAFKVMYPEEIAGKILVKQLIENIRIEEIDLCNNLKILKVFADVVFVDRSIKDIEAFNPNVKVISLKNEHSWNITVDSEYIVQKDDLLVFLGENSAIELLSKSLCAK